MSARRSSPSSRAAVLAGRLGRLVVAFGRFWWDFLVGDTPELTVGALVVLGLALLVGGGHHRWLAVVGLPVVVAAVLGASLLFVVRRTRRG